MVYLRYSITVFLGLCLTVSSFAKQVTVQNCLQEDFSERVAHKAKPFGLLKNILTVTKDKCLITIHSERYKYLKNEWRIDVCREPIHIKYGVGAVDVYKKEGACLKNSKSTFCKSLEKLMHLIEDDGLIFADGERDELNSTHGRIYCASLLIKSYLDDGKVFSRSKHYKNFFDTQEQESLPENKESSFVKSLQTKQVILEKEIEKIDNHEEN